MNIDGKWDAKKVRFFSESFFDFTRHVRINSKELGNVILGDHIYRAQNRFLDGVFDALSNDIHDIKVGKSRQLGITTVSRALTTFWCGMHKGLRGYMVFDTDGHKEEARLELIAMIEGLPKKMRFPGIKRQNRTLVELENQTVINFASAGVREGKTSGTLGRSSGINFSHNSEICSWAVGEGLEAYRNAFAEEFENRLYIWESTARGFNIWNEIYEEAKDDPDHQKTIFIGWWAKDNQIIKKSHPDFERYGLQPPTEREIARIHDVKELYGWQITDEQLAWIRRKMDPAAKKEGDAEVEFEGTTSRLQEQPWTEEDMWQMTGSVFFAPEKLTEQVKTNVSNKFQTFMYGPGLEFTDMKIYKAANTKSIELKIWEEPVADSVYIISADPAYGASEHNDRSAIQILRAYADGLDQVGEYAWPLINTRQFAWVIASLLGWYGENSQAGYILELNGPGEAVFNELQSLKHHITSGYQPLVMAEKGLKNIFQNVRTYIYSRTDAMSAGQNWHFKTTQQLKIAILERMRDFTSNGMLKIRSLDLLEEMRSIAREGDSIAAQGTKKDDRVIAMAMAVRYWEERVRRGLSTQKRTRENEAAKRRMSIQDAASLYAQNNLDNFFAAKRSERNVLIRQQRRAKWRYGR